MIRVRGARTHNLYNLDVEAPRGQFTVITGVSGSGKSSLAFDTLHAEGQRRYLETLTVDARALVHQFQRPDVDCIEGLPPTLAVSQRLGVPRPRSTLATLTEIHDLLRLLFARLGTPHCPECGLVVRKHSLAEIVRATRALPEGRKLYLLAPLVQDQPGPHRETFQYILREGFLRARVDGVLQEIRDVPKLEARKHHDIEVVVDRLVVRPGMEQRFTESLTSALKHGQGRIILSDLEEGEWRDLPYTTVFACPRCRLPLPDLEPRRFSFNNPHGACPRCTGYGQVREIDPRLLLPDRNLTLDQWQIRLADYLPEGRLLENLQAQRFAKLVENLQPAKGQTWSVTDLLSFWPEEAVDALLHGDARGPGLLAELRALLTSDDEDAAAKLQTLVAQAPCPECQGTRLNRFSRAVTFAGQSLPTMTAWSVREAALWFEANAPSTEDPLGQKLAPEIRRRLGFLQEVGLAYLTLDRPANTLSGGELQRARLASHLGGGLVGVCFILDEPTLGLHPRDTAELLKALRKLQRGGNTLLVVEHDDQVMRQADYLIDIGPGAGRDGGRLLAQGTVAQVLANPDSLTGKYLQAARGIFLEEKKGNVDPAHCLTIRGARHHNLKNITVSVPLGQLVCLTGVSGSGKSSLGRDILVRAVRRHLGLLTPAPGLHDGIEGLNHLDKVIEADQSRLGRSPRSNPASYIGLFDELRKLFAASKLAKARGYKPNRFSFNVKGGRCETCLGQGFFRDDSPLYSDVTVPCSSCRGKRFNEATLAVRFKDKNIADLLAMTVAEAKSFLQNVPSAARSLQALSDLGLGYLTLGQPSGTLSGGEAQRVKLAAELARPATGKTLVFLDEPTTGLHFADVANLINVLRQLVAAGNSVLVIEHQRDLIASADWLIDLGPEADKQGGELVACGTPWEIAHHPKSWTGRFLLNRVSEAQDTRPRGAP